MTACLFKHKICGSGTSCDSLFVGYFPQQHLHFSIAAGWMSFVCLFFGKNQIKVNWNSHRSAPLELGLELGPPGTMCLVKTRARFLNHKMCRKWRLANENCPGVEQRSKYCFNDFAAWKFLMFICKKNDGWISSAETPTSLHYSVGCNLGGQKANHISWCVETTSLPASHLTEPTQPSASGSTEPKNPHTGSSL